MMQDLKDKNRLIAFSEEFIDFNYQETLTMSAPREIEVFNQMNTKLTLFWTT